MRVGFLRGLAAGRRARKAKPIPSPQSQPLVLPTKLAPLNSTASTVFDFAQSASTGYSVRPDAVILPSPTAQPVLVNRFSSCQASFGTQRANSPYHVSYIGCCGDWYGVGVRASRKIRRRSSPGSQTSGNSLYVLQPLWWQTFYAASQENKNIDGRADVGRCSDSQGTQSHFVDTDRDAQNKRKRVRTRKVVQPER